MRWNLGCIPFCSPCCLDDKTGLRDQGSTYHPFTSQLLARAIIAPEVPGRPVLQWVDWVLRSTPCPAGAIAPPQAPQRIAAKW